MRIPPRQSGLTIIELLMALSITSFIGVSIAAMLFATARGTSDNQDQRGLLIRQKMLDSRLSAMLRSSTRILAADSDYLVLWMGDARVNENPNLSELRRIEFDAANQRLLVYKPVFPTSWTEAQIEAADTAYEISGDFNTITEALKSGSYFPQEIWMTGISEMSFVRNHTNPAYTTLVSYQATIHADLMSNIMIGAASLRVR